MGREFDSVANWGALLSRSERAKFRTMRAIAQNTFKFMCAENVAVRRAQTLEIERQRREAELIDRQRSEEAARRRQEDELTERKRRFSRHQPPPLPPA